MPLKTGKKDGQCYIKWGDQGKEYTYICDSTRSYEIAKKKALAQAMAIGEFNLASFSDYPQSIKDNAKRGIELNEKNDNKCATQVGKVRAQQLAQGEPISMETIKRMYSYLSRAETYYKGADENDCGYISYLLWGGPEALTWSKNKLEDLQKVDTKSFFNVLRDIIKRKELNVTKMANAKISFDYDDTLTKASVQDIAKQFIVDGADVYIISARRSKDGMYGIADELGISHSNIYATGSNKAKVEKILELGVSKHYDNNKDVIDELGTLGMLVELDGSIQLKKWRSTANSSNVNKILYDDETREMVIKFKSGDLYTYFDVDFSEFTAIFQGAGVTKTSGDGWDVGKSPSVGAAVYNLLVKTNKRYRKGGSLK